MDSYRMIPGFCWIIHGKISRGFSVKTSWVNPQVGIFLINPTKAVEVQLLSDLSGSAPPKQLRKIGETPSYLNANLASRLPCQPLGVTGKSPIYFIYFISSATNRTSQD